MRHLWNVSQEEALSIQRSIVREVECSDRLNHIEYIAGVDVSSNGEDKRVWATAVEFRVEKDKPFKDIFKLPLDHSQVMMDVKFPYVPGLLAFREGPAAILAIEYLKYKPDLIVFDAHGRCHPRKCGLACHLGVFLDIPSIGCAKRLLCGHPVTGSLSDLVGSTIPIVDDYGFEIGAEIRTKSGEDPVFVSIGHRINRERAESIISWLTQYGKYRLPITTEWAHTMANSFRNS